MSTNSLQATAVGSLLIDEDTKQEPCGMVRDSQGDKYDDLEGDKDDGGDDLEEDDQDEADEYEECSDDEEDSGISFSNLHIEDTPAEVQNNLDDIVGRILDGTYKNVLVLSGAGVSVAAGIPDFRTPGTGLYDNLQKYNLPFPEAVFDLDFYRSNPQPFVSLAKDLWPGASGYRPTLSHSFMRLLQDKNILLRNYTQNIDGLEVLAGVSPEKMVECHGHFREASCIECTAPYDGDKCRQKILEEGVVPICASCGGLVKPCIVFFGGESLPERFGNLIQGDLMSTDLLIVMGTSLNVTPVSFIPELVDTTCPRVLINRELVGSFLHDGRKSDVWARGDCDANVQEFCDKLGWADDLKILQEQGVN